jgi:hypothetical protein
MPDPRGRAFLMLVMWTRTTDPQICRREDAEGQWFVERGRAQMLASSRPPSKRPKAAIPLAATILLIFIHAFS